MLLYAVLWCFSAKAAIPVDSILNPKTAGKGYLSDVNHLISNDATNKINEILKRLDTAKTAQVAVVIVNTIGEKVPKEFATELFKSWGIGDKATNNGLLILLVKDQKRIEFEVGYGLEGVIPDIISNHIQQQAMIPNLKKGDYNAAILEGVKMISKTLGEGNKKINAVSTDTNDSNALRIILSWLICILYVIFTFMYAISGKKSKLGGSSVLIIICVIVGPVLFITLLAVLTPVKVNYAVVLLSIYFGWAIFYGVYFRNIEILDPREEKYTSRQIQYSKLNKAMHGLGTYTIIFPLPFLIFFYRKIQGKLKDLRYSPYQCEQCKLDMQMVTATKESFLSDGEKCAEKLGAVTYDVWRCEKDNITLKIDFIKDASELRECEKCHNITASKTDRNIEKQADYNHTGIGYDHYSCEYCKEQFDVRFIIPQLIMSTSVNSSNDRDSDSSSSSSSSSDSWGGGSSGGGGSGSNW